MKPETIENHLDLSRLKSV